MKKTILILLAFILISCGPSKEERQTIAQLTCNIMAESRNMDAAFRIKEINAGREKLGEPAFLGSDEDIKESFKYGLCTNLVLNENYDQLKNELETQEFLAQEARRSEEARLAKEARLAGREILAQKPIAQALFAELLIKIDELKLYGIQFWGGDEWSQVLLLQQDGDDDYQSAKYDLAANKYQKAMQILVDLEISVPARLQEALKKGQNAILAGNKDQAVSNFEIAVAIDSTNQEAMQGLSRAYKLKSTN